MSLLVLIYVIPFVHWAIYYCEDIFINATKRGVAFIFNILICCVAFISSNLELSGG